MRALVVVVALALAACQPTRLTHTVGPTHHRARSPSGVAPIDTRRPRLRTDPGPALTVTARFELAGAPPGAELPLALVVENPGDEEVLVHVSLTGRPALGGPLFEDEPLLCIRPGRSAHEVLVLTPDVLLHRPARLTVTLIEPTTRLAVGGPCTWDEPPLVAAWVARQSTPR